MTILTILTIQTNKVLCQAGGPSKDNNKWTGWIMMDVDRWRPLLNTEAVYDSKSEATEAMEKLVKVIREIKIPDIGDKLSDDVANIISDIISGSKGKLEDVPQS